MSAKQDEDTQDSPNGSNLGSYFNNSTSTIFDEIVSPTATDQDKFAPALPMTSKNLFDSVYWTIIRASTPPSMIIIGMHGFHPRVPGKFCAR